MIETKTPRPLPYGRHCIDEADIAAVVDVLRSDWLTTGPMVERFESAFAAAVGAPHAVACATGTAALHLAAMALRLGPNDQVIVPSITFVATANAVRFCGAEVVFADVESDSGLMGMEQLEAAYLRADKTRLKAVFPVHLAGQCAAPAEIYAWCAERGLKLVDDACHAIGTRYMHGNVEHRIGDGCHAIMSCFSLHPVKTVAMGEGGVVTTASTELAEELRRLRGHGLVRDAAAFQNADLAFGPDGKANPWYYEMPDPSPNYRASDVACALGYSQLGKLDGFIDRRQTLVAAYDARLPALAPHVLPPQRKPASQVGWHLYPVVVDFDAIGVSRSEFMRRLLRRGVGSQVHYIPVHCQPYYQQRYGLLDLPGASRYYERTLSLPLFPAMSEADVEFVVEQLAETVSGH